MTFRNYWFFVQCIFEEFFSFFRRIDGFPFWLVTWPETSFSGRATSFSRNPLRPNSLDFFLFFTLIHQFLFFTKIFIWLYCWRHKYKHQTKLKSAIFSFDKFQISNIFTEEFLKKSTLGNFETGTESKLEFL